jgi:hypothetical protein
MENQILKNDFPIAEKKYIKSINRIAADNK